MTNISKVAAIACCAIVTIGMTGCNNSSSTPAAVADDAPVSDDVVVVEDTCQVPQAVTQLATLDQNNTVTTLSAALITQELGYMLGDGGMMFRDANSENKPKEVSKLASMLSAKIQTLQKNTADVKKTVNDIGDGSLIYGDDVACDVSGTYTLHSTGSASSEDGVDTETEQLTLSFNACVMEDTGSNEMLSFFRQMTLYNSILDGGMTPRASVETLYTFNGSTSLQYDEQYTYSYDYWDDNNQPTDYGSSSEDTSKGTSSLVMDGISVEIKEDGIVRSLFAASEEISSTFTYDGMWEDTTIYSDSDTSDYNRTNQGTYKNTWNATFDGEESSQYFGDEENITVAFSACNLTTEGTSEYSYESEYRYENYSQVYYKNTNADETNTKISGYIVMQDGEEAVDLYADELMGTFADSYMDSYDNQTQESNNTNTEELSLNGTIGSQLIGGSVMLDTQNPWLMSSEYPDHRDGMVPEEVGFFFSEFYVDYSPYAGKTVLTGTNSAVVEFILDDQNMTYGTITVGDEEPVEYDSIEDMGIAYID